MRNKSIILVLVVIIPIVYLGYNLNRITNKYKVLVNENSKNISIIEKLNKENRELLSNISDNDDIDKVKSASENFLKTIFQYDEKTNRSDSIKEYVTNDFISKNNLQTTDTKVKYKSTYDKSEIYITDLKEGKVLVRVWNSFTINNIKTTTQTILTLNLIKEGNNYLINNMEIQGVLNGKGYLN